MITEINYVNHLERVAKVLGPDDERWNALSQDAKLARFKLNQEFFDHALLKEKMIYRWYPTNPEAPVAGHVHFEVEGKEYLSVCSETSFTRYSKEGSLLTKTKTPYYRIPIHLTPKQLANLNIFLNRPSSLIHNTCAGNSGEVVNKFTSLKISPFYSFSPFLSGTALRIKKILGEPLLGDISYVNNNKLSLYPLIGPVVELIILASAVSFVARFSFSFFS